MPLRLSVIGTGYLGATHAACMAELGYEVVGLDVDPAKVELLRSGRVPFYEPGLDEVLARNIEAGRLRFTTSFAEVGEFADVHFVCVGTPQAAGAQRADTSQVFGSVESLLPHLRPGALVVGKSTVPVGTAHQLAERIAESGPEGAELAWNPEFLREGFAVEDTLHPDRLVIGVRSQRAEDLLREVYAPVTAQGTPLLVMDFATAELVKVAANSFLATKISFINAIANVCEAVNADVRDVALGMGYDARIGSDFLHPGPGFGGACLPKDTSALLRTAEQYGYDFSVLRGVLDVNDRQRHRIVDKVRAMAGGDLSGARVAVLGLTFKANTDDLRDSPSLQIAEDLVAAGAVVRAFDPVAGEAAGRMVPGLEVAADAYDAAAGAGVLALLTEWDQFRWLDYTQVAATMAVPRVVDARNLLDPAAMRRLGFTYQGVGR